MRLRLFPPYYTGSGTDAVFGGLLSDVLIIQLSRLGDAIQANHLLAEWKAASPQTQFDLLSLTETATVLSGLPLRNLFLIPSPQWKALETALSEKRFAEAREIGTGILETFPVSRYRLIVNIDFAHASCWFSSHIEAEARMGGQLDAAGGRIYDDWSSLFRAVALYQNAGQLNLVDLFRSLARTGYVPGAEARPPLAAAASLPFDLPEGRRVALNPGANEAWRRWPEEKFAAVAQRLHADGWTPLLVGSRNDTALCQSIAAMCPFPLSDFSGRTSVNEMVTLLRQTELLISNDTGAVHLAAAAGTPVLGLYERISYLFTTAPWSQGNLVLYCPETEQTLSPELVHLAAQQRLGRAGRDALAQALDEDGVEGWETVFLPAGADPLSGLTYLPVHRRGLPAHRLLAYVIRHLLAQHLCGGGAVSLQPLQQWVAAGALPLDRAVAAQFDAMQQLVQGYSRALDDLAQQAALAHAAARRGDLAEMTRLAGLLSTGMNALPPTSPECPPLQLLMSYLGQKLQQLHHLALAELLHRYEDELRLTARMLNEGLRLTALLLPEECFRTAGQRS